MDSGELGSRLRRDDLGALCLGGRCSGGSGIDSDGLRRVRDPRIGGAFGFPYAVYTQLQGALARTRIFIDPLFPGIDTFADPPEVTGAFHCEGGECFDGIDDPSVAGTSTLVFTAYQLSGFACVGVRWETETRFGTYPCITRGGGLARTPEIAVLDGRPVMLWREDFDNGISLIAGTRYHSELTVRHWDGTAAFTTIWSETVFPFPTTPDIAVRDGRVYVAWVSGDGIEVEEIAAPEAPVPLSTATALLLLGWLRRRRPS